MEMFGIVFLHQSFDSEGHRKNCPSLAPPEDRTQGSSDLNSEALTTELDLIKARLDSQGKQIVF